MVKPTSGSMPSSGGSGNTFNQVGATSTAAPERSAAAEESGDFSFVVLDRSEEPLHSGFGNGFASNGTSSMPMMASGLQLQSTQSASMLLLSAIPDLSLEDVQKKLQEVLKENIDLKDTLQQNNLAMKQQMNTLVAWQEDVARVHQNHREKFEETRVLINKLRAENATQKKLLENQPNIGKLQNEIEELKQKIKALEMIICDQDALLKESAELKPQVIEMAEQLTKMREALQRAELQVIQLSEENRKVAQDNEELKNRAFLLQDELVAAQADNFVVVEKEKQNNTSLEFMASSLETQVKSVDEKLPFPQAMDRFEEKLMKALKCIVQQTECFSQVNRWLLDINDRLPSSSGNFDIGALHIMLDKIAQKLTEAASKATSHRSQLEEARHQLGRLSSDFQELHQEWLDHSKQKNEINDSKYQAAQAQGYKEQIDCLTAQLLEAQDKIDQLEGVVNTQKAKLSQQDTSVVEMKSKLETHNSIMEKKEEELQQTQKKIRTLEQSVDALTAQAEVYKMDFNEERESREKLVTEKERLADDLRALQRRNQQLLDQLEDCHNQPSQVPQQQQAASSSSAVRTQSGHNYFTIANPGRSRTQNKESSDIQKEPSPPMYECPKCQLHFRSLQPLQNHVELCLDMDMFPS